MEKAGVGPLLKKAICTTKCKDIDERQEQQKKKKKREGIISSGKVLWFSWPYTTCVFAR